MQHAISLQGIIGLRHRGLGTAEHIAGLGVVHFRNQLSPTHGLSFAHQYTLDDSHAGKAYCRSFTFFNNTYIRLSPMTGR